MLNSPFGVEQPMFGSAVQKQSLFGSLLSKTSVGGTNLKIMSTEMMNMSSYNSYIYAEFNITGNRSYSHHLSWSPGCVKFSLRSSLKR